MDDKKKRVVLSTAIETLSSLRARIEELEKAKASLASRKERDAPAASASSSAPAAVPAPPPEVADPAAAAAGDVDHAEVFDGAGVAMAILAFDGRFLEANTALCRLLGKRREELVSQGGSALFSLVAHADLPGAFQMMHELMSQRGVMQRNMELALAGGDRTVHVNVTAWTSKSAEKPCQFTAMFVPFHKDAPVPLEGAMAGAAVAAAGAGVAEAMDADAREQEEDGDEEDHDGHAAKVFVPGGGFDLPPSM